MNVLPFRIYLKQPVLLTQSSGDPNSVTSLSYLPGSVLRGVLIGRYLQAQAGNVGNDNLAADSVARRLFFDGGVSYLNAYRLDYGATRCLPTPSALLQLKSAQTDTVYNAAHSDWNDAERRRIEEGDHLKPFSPSYCTLNEEENKITPVSLAPGRIAVHVQRDREKGRATKDRGAVFQYEAIAEDQWFGGALLVQDSADVELLQRLFAQHEYAWIGRSRSANYGQVRIELDQPLMTGWREVGDLELEPVEAMEPLSITLLSDLLLRDTLGIPVASLAHQPLHQDLIHDQILSSYLGFTVMIDPARSFSNATIASGFNQTWQLPLPQQAALKAGSHLVVYPTQAITAEQLHAIELRGIGERRPEGYGRIAFQWLQAAEYTVLTFDSKPQRVQTKVTLSKTATAMAQRMARHLLDQKIDLKIATTVRDLINDPLTSNLPRNSQLGRIRGLIREAHHTQDLGVISAGMNQFKETARRQFEQARLGNVVLWNWLHQVLQPDAVWRELQLLPNNWTTVATIKPELTPQLTTQTTLRLLDAMITGLHRKNHREREEQSA